MEEFFQKVQDFYNAHKTLINIVLIAAAGLLVWKFGFKRKAKR
jgi:hypothetical protein